MSIKTKIGAMGFFLTQAALGLSATTASAAIPAGTMSGTACVAVSGTAQYTQWGVDNPSSTTDLQVVCPIPVVYQSIASTWIFFQVTAWDRSTTQDVSCTIALADPAGNVSSSQTKTTSGSSSSTPMTMPTIQVIYPPSTTDQYLALCTIPKTSGGALSHLASVTWYQ